jgi:CO/xanthine dehydrogenase FAD-binding subunit
VTAYFTPTTVTEALAILAEYDGRGLILAGGTDVLPDIRKGRRAAACLVDITRIPELGEITVYDDRVEVGACVTFAALRDHPFLVEHVHALAEAAVSVGTASIQAAATWAGNLVQAMPAADGAVVSLSLDAEAQIVDASGAAWQPVAGLFAGPGCSTVDPTRQIITRIRFARPASRWGTAWRRAGRRPSLTLPTINCAVTVVLAEDETGDPPRIAAARIALGPVAPIPFRAEAAEAFLAGQPAAPAILAEAGRLAAAEANPRSSPARASRTYRLAILPALVEDALACAAARAAGRPFLW